MSAVLFPALVSVLNLATTQVSRPSDRTYFVAPSGDDRGRGSLARPWQTIGKANRELRAGDTLYIREGEYDEIIEPYHSGEPGKPITYRNYEDERVVIRGKSGEPILVAIGLSINGPSGPDSYVVIDGLTITYGHDIQDKRFVWVIIRGSDSQYNEIRNLTIIRPGDPIDNFNAGWQEFGIVLDGAKNNLIESNHIQGVRIGLQVKRGAQFNQIRGNRITRTYQSAIVVSSSLGIIQGTLIENNTLERSAIEDGIQFEQNFGAPDKTTDISNFGTIIRNNIIRNNAENAIDLKGAAHVVIEGNIIYGTIGSNDGSLDGWNRNSHTTITRGASTATRDVIIRNNVLYDNANGVRVFEGWKIYNNTFVANNRDYTGANSTYTNNNSPVFWGIYQPEGAVYAIKNNIIVGHHGAPLKLRSGHTFDIDYNLYDRESGPTSNSVDLVDVRGPSWYISYPLPDWQALLASKPNVAGNDEHSLSVDNIDAVRFANVPGEYAQISGPHVNFDFSLRADSPARDAGGPLTYTVVSGTGSRIQLADAGYFMDGFGVTSGDAVQIGSNDPVGIIAVDYATNTITVDRSISWGAGDPVNPAYLGTAPDIGAIEFHPTTPLAATSTEIAERELSTATPGATGVGVAATTPRTGVQSASETERPPARSPVDDKAIADPQLGVLAGVILAGILLLSITLVRRGREGTR